MFKRFLMKVKMAFRAIIIGAVFTILAITIGTMCGLSYEGYRAHYIALAVIMMGLGSVVAFAFPKSQYATKICNTEEEREKAESDAINSRKAAVTGMFAVPEDPAQEAQVQPKKQNKRQSNQITRQQPKQQNATQGKDTQSKTESIVADSAIDVRTVNTNITFDNIAGYEETKKNLGFIVKCLQKPELLEQVGGKVPAGVLLYGPPGTGKTLLASAMAGTAGVNFYTANASEFVNTWVGVGPKNVRALYAEAKAHAPSIVFIDEIDAIGSKRNEQQGQEYRMTLNALLSEMDGIEKNGVITIAATNTFEELDPALIRPGRFDRKVMVPLPNYDDRLAIAKLYAAKRRIAEDVSLENLARDSAGLSGSAIATVFNEASLRALMANRGIITAADIDDALTQVLTNGEAAKNKNYKDLEIIAYHEAGHAILVRKLCGEVVPKVSVLGSTTGMAGITFISSEEERLMTSMQQIRNKIIAAYGGRAAEHLIFGKENVSTGAMQDIQVASQYIRNYMQFGGTNGSLLDEAAFSGQKGASARDLNEAHELSKQLYQEALQFLTDNKGALERVAQALLERETLFEDDLNELL